MWKQATPKGMQGSSGIVIGNHAAPPDVEEQDLHQEDEAEYVDDGVVATKYFISTSDGGYLTVFAGDMGDCVEQPMFQDDESTGWKINYADDDAGTPVGATFVQDGIQTHFTMDKNHHLHPTPTSEEEVVDQDLDQEDDEQGLHDEDPHHEDQQDPDDEDQQDLHPEDHEAEDDIESTPPPELVQDDYDELAVLLVEDPTLAEFRGRTVIRQIGKACGMLHGGMLQFMTYHLQTNPNDEPETLSALKVVDSKKTVIHWLEDGETQEAALVRLHINLAPPRKY